MGNKFRHASCYLAWSLLPTMAMKQGSNLYPSNASLAELCVTSLASGLYNTPHARPPRRLTQTKFGHDPPRRVATEASKTFSCQRPAGWLGGLPLAGLQDVTSSGQFVGGGAHFSKRRAGRGLRDGRARRRSRAKRRHRQS